MIPFRSHLFLCSLSACRASLIPTPNILPTKRSFPFLFCFSPSSFSRRFSIATSPTIPRSSLTKTSTLKTDDITIAPIPTSRSEKTSSPPRPVFSTEVPQVTQVLTLEQADYVLHKLSQLKDRFHACDTETIGFDVKKESPVGHGEIICATIYCGEDVDFGNGPRIFIDFLANPKLFDAFRMYFENPELKKVWHNYSFDKHVLANHGIKVDGFGADTLHMARLWDAARTNRGGYSLEALSDELLKNRKRPIDERFGRPHTKKDGTDGKVMVTPSLDWLQTDPSSRHDWIDYATYDTEATWRLRLELEKKLQALVWSNNPSTTMWDFYQRYWNPFGDLLTEMETIGIYLDKDHLAKIQPLAEAECHGKQAKFVEWVSKKCPAASRINPSSDVQIRQLLFAPAANIKTGEAMPEVRSLRIENIEGIIEEGKKKANKFRMLHLPGLKIPPLDYTETGWPAVGTEVLKKLAGNVSTGDYGIIYSHFGGGDEGREACEALDSLVESKTVETLLTNFIVPLQSQTDSQGRIHASLNINTETGRLSSRRPNLQNQPALEKDRFQIRRAFAAPPGKRLVVADYGQLELRLLAHTTKCRSMIEAFRVGGDFHSRTAIGMYPHVRQAVDSGAVLLEWDHHQGKAPAPLLKDKFSSERRKAKTLNFSIAYGKTAVGLAKDWGVTNEEAQKTLDLWFSDRPEVKEWQEQTIQRARKTGATRTLMGRYRLLPDINSSNVSARRHSERAAINTPLQGGAADVVMKAMIEIWRSEKLKQLGFVQILQIHDELILEGPTETAEEALELVKQLMSHPFSKPLLVDLVVDAKIGTNWYEAK